MLTNLFVVNQLICLFTIFMSVTDALMSLMSLQENYHQVSGILLRCKASPNFCGVKKRMKEIFYQFQNARQFQVRFLSPFLLNFCKFVERKIFFDVFSRGNNILIHVDYTNEDCIKKRIELLIMNKQMMNKKNN